MTEQGSILIETPTGIVRAYRSDEDGLIRAQGIPFARAPRFEPPTTYPAFETTFDAAEPCVAIPQPQDEVGEAMIGGKLLQGLKSEEQSHLSLSIVLPSSAEPEIHQASSSEKTQLPVMVWIHGGAYVTGAADARIYDPSSLVREQSLIVVKITYRLGLFGYIGDGASRPANLGLLDQLEALRWVQRNIPAFGGDAQNVTVAGQSAGGDAVIHLLACEEAPSLFRRAFIQSSPLGLRPGRDRMYAALIEASKDIDKESTEERVVEATKDLIKRALLYGTPGNMAFAPQYALAPLPAEKELEAVWKRNVAKIDVFIGCCKDEVSPFSDVIPGMNFVTNLPLIGATIKSYMIKHFTRQVYADETERIAQLMAQGPGNVWLYSFVWGPTHKFGSAHAIDLILLFGREDCWHESRYITGTPWSEIESQAKKYRALVGNFVKNSNIADRNGIPGVISYHRLTRR